MQLKAVEDSPMQQNEDHKNSRKNPNMMQLEEELHTYEENIVDFIFVIYESHINSKK